jgi:hypothetical protein
MATWLAAEYRDFDGFPRTMVCTNARGTYFFKSPLDPDRNAYLDHYEVYRIRPLPEGEACLSWFGLETRALERLVDIPVRDFPFDRAARKFLPYDAIAPLLAAAGRKADADA